MPRNPSQQRSRPRHKHKFRRSWSPLGNGSRIYFRPCTVKGCKEQITRDLDRTNEESVQLPGGGFKLYKRPQRAVVAPADRFRLDPLDIAWECHGCGRDSKPRTAIHIAYLCQHTLNLCPDCLRILTKILGAHQAVPVKGAMVIYSKEDGKVTKRRKVTLLYTRGEPHPRDRMISIWLPDQDGEGAQVQFSIDTMEKACGFKITDLKPV